MVRRSFLALVILVIGGTFPLTARGADPVILVGCPMPAQATYGQNGVRGLTMAAEEINAAGGVMLNGKKHLLKLEMVDTGDLDPKTPENEVMDKVERLITQNKVDVLVGGPNRSEYGVAVMDVIARHDRVHIACSGCYTPQWVKKYMSDPKKYRQSFRMSGNIQWYIQETRDLLHDIKEKYGFKKVFILIQDALMSRDAARIVRDTLQKDGWEIVGEASDPSETTDFTVNLTKCKKSGANVLFMWNYSPNTARLLEQWTNLEVPALPVGYVSAAEDPNFWKDTKGKCAYSVITLSEAGTTLSDITPLSRNYYLAHEKRWGIPPRSTSSAACYDGLFALKDAIQRANSLKSDALIRALEQMDLPVVRGRLRFGPNHECIFGYDPTKTILGNWAQWQDGKRVTIWPPLEKTGELKMPPWLQWWWLKTR